MRVQVCVVIVCFAEAINRLQQRLLFKENIVQLTLHLGLLFTETKKQSPNTGARANNTLPK